MHRALSSEVGPSEMIGRTGIRSVGRRSLDRAIGRLAYPAAVTLEPRRTVARLTLERALFPTVAALPPGVVLDVGAKRAPYRDLVPATEYLTLDIVPESGADIVGDIHDIPRDAETVDTVIATEVLEHCRDPYRAVAEMRRILRPGGICVLSTRFMHLYHPDPHDYFRFTSEGLGEVFREFTTVQITPLGNRLGSIWMLLPRRPLLLGWLLSQCNPAIASMRATRDTGPCGFLVRAVK
jgi:SAM-dependent methyltransferase